MKTQPTLKMPRCRTLRNSAIVLSHPKHSSTRFLFRWLRWIMTQATQNERDIDTMRNDATLCKVAF